VEGESEQKAPKNAGQVMCQERAQLHEELQEARSAKISECFFESYKFHWFHGDVGLLKGVRCFLFK